MLDLAQITKELVAERRHCDKLETEADNTVIQAINQRDRDSADRKKSLVDWLNRYKVFMGFSADSRISIAGEIIGFADERQERSLHRDKNRIISEFNLLKDRISAVAPRKRDGEQREVTSLASKSLWICYPNDVPIFDRNAVTALGVISRLCHLAPEPDLQEYVCFVDVWFRCQM